MIKGSAEALYNLVRTALLLFLEIFNKPTQHNYKLTRLLQYFAAGASIPPQHQEARPITGAWGQSPQWGPGAEPLVGVRGRSPPEADSFLALKCPKDCTNLPLLSILKGKLHMIFTTSYKISGLCVTISCKCLAQLSLLDDCFTILINSIMKSIMYRRPGSRSV